MSETPYPGTTSASVPHIYRLLAAFSGEPRTALEALEASGLRERGSRRELSDHHRALLLQLTTEARIRWDASGPRRGYVLTGYGEVALSRYFDIYGPAYPARQGRPLGEVARERQPRKEDPDESTA